MNLFSNLFNQPQIPQVEARQVNTHKGKTFLLDVRQPEEYQEGHIAGAHLLPLGELKQRMAELPRDQEIVCICRSGSRSSTAARQLAAAGYQVANMQGGMMAWNRANLPVKRGNARA